jgi:hypothetical protein
VVFHFLKMMMTLLHGKLFFHVSFFKKIGLWVSVRIGKKDLNFRIGLFDVLTGVVILC